MARSDLIGVYLSEIAQVVDATDRVRLLEELEGHLDDAVARHVAHGMPLHEAMRKAVAECGSASDVASAVHSNDERKERIMAGTRWTGVAGLVSVPAAVGGVMFWHPITFVVTLALAAFAVVGLLAVHWRVGRNHIIAGLVLLAAGTAVATMFPQGSAHPLYTIGIPAAFTLAAVTLACAAFLRGSEVPAPSVLLTLGGVAVMLGLNMAMYLGGRQSRLLLTAGGLAAITGWLWMNGALVARAWGQKRVSAA